MSYERRATRNGYIFATNVQVALITEAYLFFASGKKQPVIYVPIRHPEGPAKLTISL